MPTMSSIAQRVRTKAVIAAFPAIHQVDARRDDLVRIGSSYGGWWVPTSLINEGSVCYFAGVGTDISFDLGVIERFGCDVYAFDPTPGSGEWVKGQTLPEKFHFVPVGVSDTEGTLRFYAPADPNHISHSVKNLQRTSTYFDAPVRSISGLMAELGHTHIDVLKLDVEGAEHDTIRGMIYAGIRPRVICVEYDMPEPLSWSRATTKALRQAGYELVKVEGLNATFVFRS